MLAPVVVDGQDAAHVVEEDVFVFEACYKARALYGEADELRTEANEMAADLAGDLYVAEGAAAAAKEAENVRKSAVSNLGAENKQNDMIRALLDDLIDKTRRVAAAAEAARNM